MEKTPYLATMDGAAARANPTIAVRAVKTGDHVEAVHGNKYYKFEGRWYRYPCESDNNQQVDPAIDEWNDDCVITGMKDAPPPEVEPTIKQEPMDGNKGKKGKGKGKGKNKKPADKIVLFQEFFRVQTPLPLTPPFSGPLQVL